MRLKILALVLARGKSKRLPKKNLKKVGKKTLVELAISSGKNIKEIIDVLVSTDDKEIFKLSKKAGALVPWLRPKKLSMDNTTSADSALHALNWYEKFVTKVDGLLLLQPTSPFRRKKTIRDTIALFKKYMPRQVVSVSYTKKKGNFVNGVVYLTSPIKLRRHKTFYHKDFLPLLLKSKKECLDINTIENLKLARKLHYNK